MGMRMHGALGVRSRHEGGLSTRGVGSALLSRKREGCLLQEGEDDRLRVGRGASTAVPPLTTFTGEILANVSANVSCDDNKENSTRHTDGSRAGT